MKGVIPWEEKSFLDKLSIFIKPIEFIFGAIILLGLLQIEFFPELAVSLLNSFVNEFNLIGIILVFLVAYYLMIIVSLSLLSFYIFLAYLIGFVKRWDKESIGIRVQNLEKNFFFPVFRKGICAIIDLVFAVILAYLVYSFFCLNGTCFDFDLEKLFVFFDNVLDFEFGHIGSLHAVPTQLLAAFLAIFALVRGVISVPIHRILERREPQEEEYY